MIVVDEDGVVPSHRFVGTPKDFRIVSIEDDVPPNVVRMVLYASPAWLFQPLHRIIPPHLLDADGEPAMRYADLIAVAMGPGAFTPDKFWHRLSQIRPVDAILDKTTTPEQLRLVSGSRFRSKLRTPLGNVPATVDRTAGDWYSTHPLPVLQDSASLEKFLNSRLAGETAYLVKAAARNETAIFEELKGTGLEVAYRIYWRRVLQDELARFGRGASLPFLWGSLEVHYVAIGMSLNDISTALKAAGDRVKTKVHQELAPAGSRPGRVAIADIPRWGYRASGDTGYLFGSGRVIDAPPAVLWKEIYPNGFRLQTGPQADKSSRIANEERYLRALHGPNAPRYLDAFYKALHLGEEPFTDERTKAAAMMSKSAKELDEKGDAYDVYESLMIILLYHVESTILEYGRTSFELAVERYIKEDSEMAGWVWDYLPAVYSKIVEIAPVLLPSHVSVIAPNRVS